MALDNKFEDFNSRLNEIYKPGCEHQIGTHSGAITSLAVSSLGQTLISASVDHSMKVWDTQANKVKHHFQNCHDGKIFSVVISPDDRVVYSASSDKAIKIWDLESLSLKHSIPNAHGNSILTLSISSDGNFLASGSADGSVKIWKIDSIFDNKPLITISKHKKPVLAVSLSSNGAFVVSGSKDTSILVWDIAKNVEVKHITDAHKNSVTGLAFAPDDKLFASVSDDKSLKIWNFENFEPQVANNAHKFAITAVIFSNDGKLVFTASKEKLIKSFTTQAKLSKTFPNGHDDYILAIVLSKGEQSHLFSASKDAQIKRFDATRYNFISAITNAHKKPVRGLLLGPGEKQLFAFDERNIKIWTQNEEGTYVDKAYSYGEKIEIKCFDYSSIDGSFYAGCRDGKLRQTVSAGQNHEFGGKHAGPILAIAVTGDGKNVITGSDDNCLFFWKVMDKKLETSISAAHKKKITLTSDSSKILSASADRYIKIWNFDEKILIYSFQDAHTETINFLSISKNNELLLSGSEDKSLKVWNITTKSFEHSFDKAHTEGVTTAQFTEDLKYIISSSSDCAIKVWSYEHKQIIHEIEGAHPEAINSIVVTKNGKNFFSCSKDRTIKKWCLFEEYKAKFERFENPIKYAAVLSDNVLLGHADKRIEIRGKSEPEVIETSEMAVAFSASQNTKNIAVKLADRTFKVYQKKDGKNGVYDAVEISRRSGINTVDQVESLAINESNLLTSLNATNFRYWKIKEELELKKNITIEKFYEGIYSLSDIESSNKAKNKDQVERDDLIHQFEDLQRGMIKATIAKLKDQILIITAGEDASIAFWDFKTRKLLHHIENAHNYTIGGLAFSGTNPQNQVLVSISDDRSIKIWDVKEYRMIKHIPNAHNAEIYSLEMSYTTFYTGDADGFIKKWSLNNHTMVEEFRAHDEPIWAISKKSKTLATGCNSGIINIWTVEDKKPITLKFSINDAHEESIYCLLLESENRLISGSYDKTIKIWGIKKSAQLIHHFDSAHDSFVLSLVLSSEPKVFFSCSADGSIKCWDLDKKELLNQIESAHDGGTESLCLVGKLLVSSGSAGALKIWNFGSKAETDGMTTIGGGHEAMAPLCLSNDSKYFVSVLNDSVILYDLENDKTHYVMRNAHSDQITCVVFSINNNFFVTGSKDRSIKVWSLEKKDLIYEFKDAHYDPITCLTISEDDEYIVSASEDETIKLWSLRLGSLIHTIEDPNGKPVISLHLSVTDRAHKLTAIDENGIKSWDLPALLFVTKCYPITFTQRPVLKEDHDFIIMPQRWNQYHYLMMNSANNPQALTEFLERLENENSKDELERDHKFYKDLALIDSFNKIPFDYYVDKKNLHSHLLATSLVRILESQKKNNPLNFLELMAVKSDNLVKFLKEETNANSIAVTIFLKLCVDKFEGDDIYNHRIAHGVKKVEYGVSTDKVVEFEQPVFDEKIMAQVMEEPDINSYKSYKLAYYRTTVPLSLSTSSKLAKDILGFLTNQSKRFYFEDTFIQLLLDYFWQKSKLYQVVFFLIHSVIIVIYTINVANSEVDVQKPVIKFYNIFLLILTGPLLFYELIQLFINRISHLKDLWNILDLTFQSALVSSIILSMTETDTIAIAYLKTIALFCGYFRWMGHLRIFDGMRSLIRTIIEIIKDMKNLMIILIITVSAYAAILEAFNFGGDASYLNNLYNSYFFIYDSKLDQDPNFVISQLQVGYGLEDQTDLYTGLRIITMAFPFIINVIFLNMLISIMGDTFDKLQEKKTYADNIERVRLILELATISEFWKNIFSFGIGKKFIQRLTRVKRLFRRSTTNIKRQQEIDKKWNSEDDKKFYLLKTEQEVEEFERDWEGKMNYIASHIDEQLEKSRRQVENARKQIEILSQKSVEQIIKTEEIVKEQLMLKKEIQDSEAKISKKFGDQLQLIQRSLNYLYFDKIKEKAEADCAVELYGLETKKECVTCQDCRMEVCLACAQECHKGHKWEIDSLSEGICKCLTHTQTCKKTHHCTYKFTGPKYAKQLAFICKTCKMTDGQCFCPYCARTCHAGHVIRPIYSDTSYCDCPSVCKDICKGLSPEEIAKLNGMPWPPVDPNIKPEETKVAEIKIDDKSKANPLAPKDVVPEMKISGDLRTSANYEKKQNDGEGDGDGDEEGNGGLFGGEDDYEEEEDYNDDYNDGGSGEGNSEFNDSEVNANSRLEENGNNIEVPHLDAKDNEMFGLASTQNREP